jgi:hypothetical protein
MELALADHNGGTVMRNRYRPRERFLACTFKNSAGSTCSTFANFPTIFRLA